MSLKDALARWAPPPWLPGLEQVVGAENVLCEPSALWVYSRDRSPFATFSVRNSRVPFTLPAAVVRPANPSEVADVLKFARRSGIAVIPYGAGSGVLGGTLPLANELIVDTKRLDRIVEINTIDGTATIQAGLNGGQYEKALNAYGFTSGHFPQSLHMSTVGGWLACRGAGQASTRYGKIEDMVVGLEAVLPDGRRLRVRPAPRRATGPGLMDFFIGSEGAFGILTEATLRIWRKPEVCHGLVLAFPHLQAALDAVRTIMQRELRPTVVRLYDHHETSQRAAGLITFAANPIMAIMEFSGTQRLADAELALALEIAGEFGAIRANHAPYDKWLAHRFAPSSSSWHAEGGYSDTIEIAANWSVIPHMYERMRKAVEAISSNIAFSAHWSHAYPEGVCQYMTVRFPATAEKLPLTVLEKVWDEIQNITIEMGGTISHHHGVGLFRNRWMCGELGTGLDVLRAFKKCLDPDNLLAPGKLGLDVTSKAGDEG